MVVLSLSRSIVEALISTIQSGLALPSEPTGSLVLELALEPLIARLEALTQRSFQLCLVREVSKPAPYLEFEVRCGSARGKGLLFLFSPLDGPVPSAFLALRELLCQLPKHRCELPAELPIIVSGEMGSLRVPTALVRSARVGDALLPDVLPFSRGEISLSAGLLRSTAGLAGDQLILRGPFRPRTGPVEYPQMTKEPESRQQLSDSDLDDVEIMLVFECGRWPMPLGELRSAGEGHVFELGRPIDGPVDILANGRLIGRGDIVRIGDELGIRLRSKLCKR
ncbi:type III secretion system cytoplasmic ring protein SctQ [Rhizobium grahamii]|nr:type III secretion system cytoplasmic ring protein SctQ [Rhizobium grahamii]